MALIKPPLAASLIDTRSNVCLSGSKPLPILRENQCSSLKHYALATKYGSTSVRYISVAHDEQDIKALTHLALHVKYKILKERTRKPLSS